MNSRRAFTLVELLVVIAIIGILVALLLPAVQAAREAARRSECTSHQKNIVLAMLNHESTHGSWPASGWKGHWSGDPDRGAGANQPGAWLFGILPFIEEQATYDMGSGAKGAERKALLGKRDGTTLPWANCPTRRSGGPYPQTITNLLSGDGTGAASRYTATAQARGDYAASVGDETNFDGKCLSLAPDAYNVFKPGFPPPITTFSGVSFCGVAVKSRNITDGLSKTIAIGERYVPVKDYETGNWLGDDWNMYVGFQDDTVRSTYYGGRYVTHNPVQDSDVLSGAQAAAARELFGSAHPGGCLFGMCDGSVSLVAYDVDPQVFRQMGHRADGGSTK